MKIETLQRLLSAATKDLFFSHNRAIWTDDPTFSVVQLRNKIIDLVEGRVTAITGATSFEESYLLAPSGGRYALVRILNQVLVEGTYFERGWPDSQENWSRLPQLKPQPLDIRGTPYKIVMNENPNNSQIVLSVES